MNDSDRLQLVGGVLNAAETVLEKAASAQPAQRDVLNAGWPSEGENIEKRASLARMLATATVVREAEAALSS